MKAEAGTPCTLKDPTAPTDAAEAHGSDPVEVSKFKAEQRATKPATLSNVTVKPIKPPPAPTAIGGSESPAATEEKTEQHFIEIELQDDDGTPIPDEPFEVELADGSIISGRLDENGTARVEGIPDPGSAKIHFPRMDSDEYKAG